MNALLCLLLVGLGDPPPAPSRPLAVQLAFSKQAAAEPFTGRVFLLASREPIKGTPPRQSWFKPFPFFAQDVRNWRPDEPLTFQPQYAFPHAFDKLPAEKFYFQAVLDLDRGGQNCLTAPGNVYSKAMVVDAKSPAVGPLSLVLDQVVPQNRFQETERVKLVDIDSKLLSQFHGKPVRLRGRGAAQVVRRRADATLSRHL